MTAQRVGNFIDGKFRIEAEVGSGGFGRVYRAQDVALKRQVAVKVLDVAELIDNDAKVRFEREAKVLSALQHPHIVSIYSYGRDDSDRPYISMQMLEGRTLGDALRTQGALPWKRACMITRQICAALAAAHAMGIVHRDLKPDNIMLLDEPESDYVKVLDFGMSGFVAGAAGEVQKLTQTGAIVGTLFYMSPEMCQGQRADNRCDIYSLGCILYECLTGKMPIEGDDALHLLYKHVHDLPARLIDSSSSIPKDLELIVFKAMQKDPADRFQTMEEFEQALNMVLGASKEIVDLSGVRLAVSKQQAPRLSMKMAVPMVLVFALAGVSLVYFSSKDAATQNAAISDREYSDAKLLWQRRENVQAFEHFKRALAAAPDPHRRYLAGLGTIRYALAQGTNPNLPRANLVEALAITRRITPDAQTEDERQTLHLVRGILAHDSGDLELAYKELNGEPWTKIKLVEDGTLTAPWVAQRAKDALAESLQKGSHRDFARADRLLRDRPPVGYEPPKTRTTHLLGKDPTWERMASNSGRSSISEKEHAVLDANIIRNRIKAADTPVQMLAAIDEGKKLALRFADKPRELSMLRTFIGVGYYDIGRFKESLLYLRDRPWTKCEPGDIPWDWSQTAAECRGNLLLMVDGDTRSAIQELKSVVELGDLRDEYQGFVRPRAQFFLAAAYLMTKDSSLQDEAERLLKPVMKYRSEILFESEEEFIRQQLAKRNLLRLWS